MMEPKQKVLVLCTGNSCRSIMAEALINHLFGDQYEASSAGSKPEGYVHPKSLETLERRGIQVTDPRSQSWDEFVETPLDLVITVCDRAANESCPVFLGDWRKLHWSTPDPAKAQGTDADIDRAFDSVFDQLKRNIEHEFST